MPRRDYPARIATISMRRGKMSWMKTNWKRGIKRSSVPPATGRNPSLISNRPIMGNVSAATRNPSKIRRRLRPAIAEGAMCGSERIIGLEKTLNVQQTGGEQ
jgi:hypothetical protein